MKKRGLTDTEFKLLDALTRHVGQSVAPTWTHPKGAVKQYANGRVVFTTLDKKSEQLVRVASWDFDVMSNLAMEQWQRPRNDEHTKFIIGTVWWEAELFCFNGYVNRSNHTKYGVDELTFFDDVGEEKFLNDIAMIRLINA